MKKILPIKTDVNQSHNAFLQTGLLNFILNFSSKNNKKTSDGAFNQILFQVIAGIIILFITPFFQKPQRQVDGINTSPVVTPVVTPTPADICTAPDFVKSLWDLSHYYKDSNDFYLPIAKTNKGFWYPPLTYKNTISGVFKNIDIDYQATYQNKDSTRSATLFVALYDEKNDEVFEILAPEPNRQLIGFKKLGNFSDKDTPIAPIVLKPFTLGRQVSYTGTHTISITTQRYTQNSQTVVYTISGTFIDNHGVQQNMRETISVELPTSDPSLKQFHFVVGTGIGGKIKIERINICDQ